MISQIAGGAFTGAVGVGFKLITSACKKAVVYNNENSKFERLIYDRPKGRGIITVMNHISTVDDPGIVGNAYKRICDHKRMKWTLGAEEIMFTNPFYRVMFGFGAKVIPIVRGAGIEQKGVHTAIEKLNQGEWVQIFPEGKVTQNGAIIRFKWGIAKMLESCHPVVPWVLPVYHLGFEKIMPEGKMYIPKPFGKEVHIIVGDIMEFDEIVAKHKSLSPNDHKPRLIEIVKVIEMEMKKLEKELYLKMKENSSLK